MSRTLIYGPGFYWGGQVCLIFAIVPGKIDVREEGA
jgi:hypothetical protein